MSIFWLALLSSGFTETHDFLHMLTYKNIVWDLTEKKPTWL